MMIITKKLYLFIIIICWSLVSCDSREDWFSNNSDIPDLVYSLDGVSDTINQGDVRKIVINLKPVGYSYRELYTDTVSLEINAINSFGQYQIAEAIVSSISDLDYSYKLEQKANEPNKFKIHFCISDYYDGDKVGNGKEIQFLDPYLLRLNLTDIFSNEMTYMIEVNIEKINPPFPILELKQLQGMEYALSLDKSYDLDGEIKKYEWCIDGNVLPYSESDFRIESKRGNWNAGKSAYGGTYITATELNSINHSFQEKGQHIVYFRCMDDLGAWSMWNKQIINIE